MKKYILVSLIFTSFAVSFASDLTQYKNVRLIQEGRFIQPTIVQISNLSQMGDYVVTDDTGKYIEQQSQTTKTSNIILPTDVQGCTTSCKNAITLADGNVDTTFDFPLLSSGLQKGKIKIMYASPLETDSIVFQTTQDSYMPTAFTLMIDGKRILNTIQGGRAHFPKMMAQNIEIEFEYAQPIRFTEVGVGFNKVEHVSGVVRFVYQPHQKYILYLDSPTGRESLPLPAVNLFAKNKEAEVVLEEIHKNPLYKERDTDVDDVIDSVDNCPLQKNSDQKDSNGNAVGDVCDDYDYDGVPTYMDNCPVDANPNQMDIDRDGIGDVCDKEESRTTEKYPWMPWVVFVGVLGAVGAMGYEVIRMKRVGK